MSWMLAQKSQKLAQQVQHVGSDSTPTTAARPVAPAPSGQDAVWVAACKQDWDWLKTIPVDADGSHATRNKAKPAVLDKYRDYLRKWIYANRRSHTQNDVLVRNLIWAMDCGAWHYGVELADACVTTGQTMTLMERTCTTFACDCVLQAAEASHREGKPLQQDLWGAFEMVLGRLIHPETEWKTNPFVLAKYHRLAAKLAKDTDPERALRHAEAANALDANVGVKTLITDLRKQLQQSPPLQAGGAGNSGEVVSLPTPDDPTPVAPVLPILDKDKPAG